MEFVPLKFISETIEVHFLRQPTLEKKPGPPDSFTWRDENFTISEVLSEWHDYKRRGRMLRNMHPQHAAVATHRGSWGVGQDYYRICTRDGRYFDIYYDRSPKDVDNRKGTWFLDRELAVRK